MSAGARRRSTAACAALAAAFVAFHLPFLPASLEDVDSINFALGLHHFDVAHHQPHPPGYPVFIALGRLSRAVTASDAHALAVLGIAAGALSIFALASFFDVITEAGDPPAMPTIGAAVAVVSPLFWITAARPLSDVTGLAAALGVQALAVHAATTSMLAAAAFCAGAASGIRSQVAWLTVPLIALVLWRRPGRARAALATSGAFAGGLLIWGVPLLLLSGGISGYWTALSGQGSEDLSGIQMLWTTPTLRVLVSALYYAFVAPWAVWPLAASILLLAGAGLWRLRGRSPHGLAVLVAAFGPYLVFDILFQETFTTRYALPLVVPVAALAVSGMAIVRRAALPIGIAIALWSFTFSAYDLRAYASAPAPAFQMLGMMQTALDRVRDPAPTPILAAHRREDLDLRRPLAWSDGRLARLHRLPAPPKHEWLELVRYWTAGGRAPVWFAADPLRSDLALIDPGPEVDYVWRLNDPVLLGGVRPGEIAWHVFDRPGWYLGEGWAITPETAGVARQDGRGPAQGGVEGWIRARPDRATVMLGGRNMNPSTPAHLRAAINGRVIEDAVVAPGFFLRFVDLSEGVLQPGGDYVPLTVSSDDERLAIEQFDAQSAGRLMFGYGDGWYEHEYNPATGLKWRWTSGRADLVVAHAVGGIRVSLAGRTETFTRRSRVRVRIGDRVVADDTVGETFAFDVGIPGSLLDPQRTVVTIETDQTYVPAERSRRSRDRRHLGLRITRCAVTPVS